MQYAKMAKELASRGRGKDTKLMHVTPDELQALERLGALTYNPDTGLPEAGFFSDLLSFAAPIVGGIFGGPVGAAIGGGLGAGVRGGNPLVGAAGGFLGSSLGGYLGDALGGGVGGGVGEGLGEGFAASIPEISESFFGDALGGTFGEAGLSLLASSVGSSAGDFGGWFDTSPMSFSGGGAIDSGPLGMGPMSSLTMPTESGPMSSLTMPTESGPMSILDRLKKLPWKNVAGGLDIAKSLYGMNQASRLSKMSQQAMERADPYGPYRGDAAARLALLTSDPSRISETPGYEAGMQAIQRGLAGSGYLGSGNEKVAMMKYGGDIYNQETSRLAQLAGAGFSPAAASQVGLQGQAGAMNLRGNALNNLARGIWNWGA